MNGIQNYGITNCQQSVCKNNVSFGARFCSKDIEKLIDEAMHEKECGRFPQLPQLYTYLERLDEIKNGLQAKLKMGDVIHSWGGSHSYPKILIDEKVVCENLGANRGYQYWLNALKQLITDGTVDFLKMPESILEQKVWEHRNVTADDIRKFTYGA